MSPLLSIPGDIPALLRPCSPIIKNGRTNVVGHVLNTDGERPLFYFVGAFGCRDIGSWRLNLDDATGCAHAAAWVAKRVRMVMDVELQPREQYVIERAVWYEPLRPEDIDLLARLVCRLAERKP